MNGASVPHPDRARTAGVGMFLPSGNMCWCTRTQESTQAERLGEGLGHRGGGLRDLIQDP